MYVTHVHAPVKDTSRPLGYERVYLPLTKVADTSFHIQGDEVMALMIVLIVSDEY